MTQLLRVGSKVNARDEGGVMREAIIKRIEESVSVDHVTEQRNNSLTYYVTWPGVDRRQDQWISEEFLIPYRKEGKGKGLAAKALPRYAQGTGVLTRRKKKAQEEEENQRTSRSEFEAFPSSLPTESRVKGQQQALNLTSTRKKDSVYFYLPRNVDHIFMGKWRIPTWYHSPYLLARNTVLNGLEEAVRRKSGTQVDKMQPHPDSIPNEGGPGVWHDQSLHICPYCCAPFVSDLDCTAHVELRCVGHPPGREVYRDPRQGVIVFEVCGLQEAIFAQNLCLLSKLFLEHQLLDFEVSDFVFYVLCVSDKKTTGTTRPSNIINGCEVAAYFSRQKSSQDHNLSCILSLPQFQGAGYGRFLVEMSYEMSLREGTVGTPETPLSDLGEVLYKKVWDDSVMDILVKYHLYGELLGLTQLSVSQISKLTGITEKDVSVTIKRLGLGVRGGAKDDPFNFTLPEEMCRRFEKTRLESIASGRFCFQKFRLVWNPSQVRNVAPRTNAGLPQRKVVAKLPAPIARSLQVSFGRQKRGRE